MNATQRQTILHGPGLAISITKIQHWLKRECIRLIPQQYSSLLYSLRYWCLLYMYSIITICWRLNDVYISFWNGEGLQIFTNRVSWNQGLCLLLVKAIVWYRDWARGFRFIAFLDCFILIIECGWLQKLFARYPIPHLVMWAYLQGDWKVIPCFNICFNNLFLN